MSPETDVRTFLTGDGDDAACGGVAGGGEVPNLGFRVRWGRGARRRLGVRGVRRSRSLEGLRGRLRVRWTGNGGGWRRAGRRGGARASDRGWRQQAVRPAAAAGASERKISSNRGRRR
jgi:hypothetical protein